MKMFTRKKAVTIVFDARKDDLLTQLHALISYWSHVESLIKTYFDEDAEDELARLQQHMWWKVSQLSYEVWKLNQEGKGDGDAKEAKSTREEASA